MTHAVALRRRVPGGPRARTAPRNRADSTLEMVASAFQSALAPSRLREGDDARRRERRRGARGEGRARLWRRVCEGRSRARRRNGDVRRQKKAKEFRKGALSRVEPRMGARRTCSPSSVRSLSAKASASIVETRLDWGAWTFHHEPEEEADRGRAQNPRFRARRWLVEPASEKRRQARRTCRRHTFGSRGRALLRA